MRSSAIYLAALAIAAPAAAQDGSEASGARTPENAQKFLEVAAGKFGLFMEGTSGLTSGRFDAHQLRYGNLRISSDGKCKTRFDGTITEYWVKDDAVQVVLASGADASPDSINELGKRLGRSTLKSVPYVLDWSTVTNVGVATDYDPQKGTRDMPEGAFAKSPAQSVTLITPSEEIGNRVRLAMETLRMACDSTQELGF